jgi:hypothetical protein
LTVAMITLAMMQSTITTCMAIQNGDTAPS